MCIRDRFIVTVVQFTYLFQCVRSDFLFFLYILVVILYNPCLLYTSILKLAGTSEIRLFLLVMLVTSAIGAFVSNTGTVALMLDVYKRQG